MKESTDNLNSSPVVDAFVEQQTAPAPAPVGKKQEIDVVSDHPGLHMLQNLSESAN